VLDAKTGEILALANLPAYNRIPCQAQPHSTRNRAVTDTFEQARRSSPYRCGVLEAGKFKADSPVQTAPGTLTIGLRQSMTPIPMAC